jgi:hypothetical protein
VLAFLPASGMDVYNEVKANIVVSG